MRIGAAVAGPEQRVVPLPDGDELVILDTESGAEQRVANPAHSAEKQRRLVAAEEFIQRRVEAVVSVPLTFCPTSHARAKQAGIRFISVPAGTTWDQVKARSARYAAGAQESLPEDELFHH
ncbi:MAG: hypothetical protein IMX01_01090 [Limnochordaceae bacterium]|nr:hypothetical protein [Limnochordaceae bacterium]